tara:strand:+ start:4103 stop:5017 length:915 start_codon:yes stop_codon:yes gene_type:complete
MAVDPKLVKLGIDVIGGLFGAKKAKEAAQKRAAAYDSALSQFRDPSQIVGDFYGPSGFFGDQTQGLILGTESRLIPGYTDLQKLRAQQALFGQGGLQDLAFQSQMDMLENVKRFGGDIRDTLEDPRLGQLADIQMQRAQQAATEAAGPLDFEAAREAEQSAIALGARSGRARDASTIARATLNRQDARIQREQRADSLLGTALKTAEAARINPLGFFQMDTPESTAAKQFLTGQLGTQVTDLGQALEMGMAKDQRMSDAILAKAGIKASGDATAAKAYGNVFGSIGDFMESDSGGKLLTKLFGE